MQNEQGIGQHSVKPYPTDGDNTKERLPCALTTQYIIQSYSMGGKEKFGYRQEIFHKCQWFFGEKMFEDTRYFC
jgi:hypothetical protein